MGTLADALFSRTQQEVLGLLYGQPEKSFYINEILRSTGMGVATIKRELDRMEAAGILQRVKIGNQQHYQAEPLCTIFKELRGLVSKTLGVSRVVSDALLPLESRIELAFLFGSIARGTETTNSDIDLMLVGHISLEEVVELTYPVQESLGRPINPRIYSPDEWQVLLKERGSFIKDVMKHPRMDLIGNTDEPGQSGWQDAGTN
jgi:uncharacterized protein